MPLFLLGVALGALSGVGTYVFTSDGPLAAIVGAVAMVLTWLGVACVMVLED